MKAREVRRIVDELIKAASAWALANDLAYRSEIGSHRWERGRSEAAVAQSAIDALTEALAIGAEDDE